MHSPFFRELNQVYEESRDDDDDDRRGQYAVAVIVQHVRQELLKFARCKGTPANPATLILIDFEALPGMYKFLNQTEQPKFYIKFPDLERARAQLAKDIPEITWKVVDQHRKPGECECLYCVSYRISATWTWAPCDTEDLT